MATTEDGIFYTTRVLATPPGDLAFEGITDSSSTVPQVRRLYGSQREKKAVTPRGLQEMHASLCLG